MKDPTIRLSLLTMPDDESFTFGSLSEMKVSELREICKKGELLISGNKADLIVRILENNLKNQDGYIIDSLGWAMFKLKK